MRCDWLQGYRGDEKAFIATQGPMVNTEQKNGIELYVASDRPGNTMPRPAEEVIQSLNVKILHRYLGYFGITEVSSEV
ncbi:hypothetical protein CRUP_013320 [Coryphaenoides rupestris]|nr:hypothetical protein CRUP_013320 [Coryphaenoides rupestris]